MGVQDLDPKQKELMVESSFQKEVGWEDGQVEMWCGKSARVV